MIEAQSQTNETTWTNLGKASPHHFRRSEWVEEDAEPSRTSLPRSQPLAKPAYPGKFPKLDYPQEIAPSRETIRLSVDSSGQSSAARPRPRRKTTRKLHREVQKVAAGCGMLQTPRRCTRNHATYSAKSPPEQWEGFKIGCRGWI